MKNIKIIARMIVCVVVLSLMISLTAFAAGAPDLKKDCELSIVYSYGNKALTGAEFAVYHVGSVSAAGKLQLTGEFKDYPVVVDGLNDEQFAIAADTLASFAALNHHSPLSVMTIDETGGAELTGLEAGLYLIVPNVFEASDQIYVADNMLLVLPHEDSANGQWFYNVRIQPKAQVKPAYTDLNVVKIWDDAGSKQAYRPKSITVYLLCNGRRYDQVTLSKENNWRHSWSGLSTEDVWSVAEDVPDKYTVTIKQQSVNYVITNHSKTPPPPTPTPTPSIPQTGQTWWPVPVLLLGGLTLVAVGIAVRKDSDEA